MERSYPSTPGSSAEDIIHLLQTQEEGSSLLTDDDKLTIVAKLGTSLLEKNQRLEEELTARVDELEEVKYALESQTNTLNDKLQMSHNQWEKNRIEARMKNFFEEHDENQNKIIDSHTQTIKHLEALIKKLKADQIESSSGEMAMKQQQEVVQSQETIVQEPINTIPTTSNKQ